MKKGTNFIKCASKAELVKIIGIGKNQISKKLRPSEDKGYICFIGKKFITYTKALPIIY